MSFPVLRSRVWAVGGHALEGTSWASLRLNARAPAVVFLYYYKRQEFANRAVVA